MQVEHWSGWRDHDETNGVNIQVRCECGAVVCLEASADRPSDSGICYCGRRVRATVSITIDWEWSATALRELERDPAAEQT